MAHLSRTASRESAASSQKSQTGSLDGDLQSPAVETSGPPSPSNTSKSLASTGRVPSHSLLTAPQGTHLPNRKSHSAEVGTVGGNTGRASISMPPPATKPSSIYKPSSVRRPTVTHNASDVKEGQNPLDGTAEERETEDTARLEDGEKSIGLLAAPTSEPQSPVSLPDSSLKPPTSTLNQPGDRLSFSSLYSLGSAIYNGATGPTSAPPSAASSTAGSVKSTEQPTPTATPMSPSLGASKGDAASLSTTATDPVSVMANSQPLHQGSRVIQSLAAPLRIMLIILR